MTKVDSIFFAAVLSSLTNLASAAAAPTDTTLTVTGSVGSSIEFTIAWGESGQSANVTAPLGQPSKSSLAPPGWEKTEGDGTWTLFTSLVALGNVYNCDSCAGYNMKARLGQAPIQDTYWSLRQNMVFGGVTITVLSISDKVVETDLSFSRYYNYRLGLDLKDSSQGSLSNSIIMTVTAR